MCACISATSAPKRATISYSPAADSDIRSMLKGFKFTLFSAIFIIGAFISESLYIIYLNSKIEESADVAELIQKSGEALAGADLNLKDELIYDYAILNANGEILRSNLSVQPPDFAFITLKFGGRVFFKRHFLHEGKLYFFVISKKISYAKIEFIAISTIFITIFVALIIALFNYKIIKNFYAQQSNLIKAFFNDAMHELKTPLGVALINTEMLGLRDKHTARIKSALKQMVITYEDVEYFIKSGKMSLKSRRIDMSEFLGARINFIYLVAKSKNISLQSRIAPDVSVFMDETSLMRLIDNTLSNAIKYSRPGGKVIIALEKGVSIAVFSVQDFGIGIKDTSAIWARYSRENAALGGFGLGLNIIEKICKRYGIAKSVRSKPNEGSTFCYKIPLFKQKLLD